MAEKTKKIWYIGKRYMPKLEHPRFGKFMLNDDGSFDVPFEYADDLLVNTPKMFAPKRPMKKEGAFTGAEYSNMSYEQLQKYAMSRKVKAIGVKKKQVRRQ